MKNVISLTSKNARFNSVFKLIDDSHKLEIKNDNSVEIFCLSKMNCRFTYEELKKMLKVNIARYVFDRNKVKESEEQEELELLVCEAIKVLREIKSEKDKGAGGELGELLLYLFLEGRLGAPKILSKMELKTTRNQYIYGADGIFMHKLSGMYGATVYQLILGEAKIQNKWKKAIDSAFKSIINTLEECDIEKNLIATNILNETMSKEEAEKLKRLIIPSAKEDEEEGVFKENAFGIFLGYSIEYDDDISNIEWCKGVESKIKDDVREIKEYVMKKIIENDLKRYSFYIYMLPFNNAQEDRKNILKDAFGL